MYESYSIQVQFQSDFEEARGSIYRCLTPLHFLLQKMWDWDSTPSCIWDQFWHTQEGRSGAPHLA